MNLVERGMNGGWVQIMGPVGRIQQFKQIETTSSVGRPARSNAPADPLAGDQHRRQPARGALAPARPAGIALQRSGVQLALRDAPSGDRLPLQPRSRPAVSERPVRGSGDAADDGRYLFRFNLTGNRRKIAVDDPRLDDRVADNNAKHDITESESLLFGTDFGVGTDVETGPNGNLFVVSPTQGAVYEIFRR